MKKIFIFILFLPIFVFADCDVINDSTTDNIRNLTCDENLLTTTKYSTKDEVLLDNGVCKVTCDEEIIFSFDPIKKVIAGMSFSYPLRTSGERKCSATYNYSLYEQTIKNLVNNYNVSTGEAKVTAKNEIVNYYAKKQACDEFDKEDSDYNNKYSYNGKVSLNLETSTSVKNINYNFVENDRTITSNKEDIYYESCNLNTSTYKCDYSDSTILKWTSTTRVDGKYTMPDKYIEKYTGKDVDVATTNTCNAKDRYFTDLKEITRPLTGDVTDNGYDLNITATSLGSNLVNDKKWNLNISCWYQVKNLSFPQSGKDTTEDEEYEKIGSSGFMYRLINLNDPFPGRDANANWKGFENIILSSKDNISTLKKFIITLDRANIRKVKEYNTLYPYSSFNLNDEEKSQFIINNPGIVDRK